MTARADPAGVAGLDREQWQEASRALAAAFYDDPVLSWLIPADRRRLRALESFFAIETRDIVLGHGRSVGCRSADGQLTPVRVQVTHGPQVTRIFGRRLPVALGVLTKMEARHPRDPHVYRACPPTWRRRTRAPPCSTGGWDSTRSTSSARSAPRRSS